MQLVPGFETDFFSFRPPNNGFGIGLQVTSRATHQVMTRIFSIFLKEVLNYKDVQIIPLVFENSSDPENLLRTLKYVKYYKELHQISMINLEVWAPYTIHKEPQPNIYSAGASIAPGRFSWFVPRSQISIDNKDCSLHYEVFKDINNAYYSLYIMDDNVIKILRDRSVEEYANPNCGKINCATLIAEWRNDSYFITEELNESYLNVVWLGDQFRDTIKELHTMYSSSYTRGQKRFVVLHWVPSEIIDADIKFAQIALPRCEDYEFLKRSNCRYELTPILKYYPGSLIYDKRMMYALRNFYINDMDLKNIQKELSIQRAHTKDSEELFNNVACNWLLQNFETYSRWVLPRTVKTLSIGGIFPIYITDWGHENIIEASQRAVDVINENKTVLPNYNLEILIKDGQCKSDMVLKSFIHYFNKPNMLGVLGPACSETVEPIAGISKHLNMMIISYSAEGNSFVDREAYPYFFRTIGSNSEYVDAYIKIMQQLGWCRVSTLTEDSQQYTGYLSRMESKLRLFNFTLAFSRKVPSDVTAPDMREHLVKLKEAHSRIIIAELQSGSAAITICEAIKLGMTQKENYVWFLPSWLSKDYELWNMKVDNRCSIEQFRNAIEGHLSIRHTPFGELNAEMQEGMSINSWLTTYKNKYSTFSSYVGFVYDAVWTYALAAHKLLENNSDAFNELRSIEVTKKLSKLIRETDFNGLSGHVRFGTGEFGGSRIIDLDILQWRNSTYERIGLFKPIVEGSASKMHINGGHLNFSTNEAFHGQVPEDGRYDCRFSALARCLHVTCDIASMIFIIFQCLIIIVLMSLISCYFWKKRYDRKVRQSAQIMKMFGIDLISPSRNKVNTLDKWEVQKDNVVINRRLGEGAFGTVFGGEARLGSDEWTAVAVKTLKAGQSTEDRLDFLAEAEAMKKFSHKNIIKLLGVCLQTEPIYTIMEFMLYGDLKTYLLARRNMVNEKIADESDISSKRLTMYAMDVARGLAYLEEQKYVHRDIACRNCLVNSQRVVKIGDFGMARPTIESDYYCFNRKGVRKLFPVRWMPPETLSLGLFTTASDIWSFGVVLYEIISFGSYPYQGLTNNQVLDFVKAGNTLRIPNGVKPQLEGLLKSCWSQDVSKRPTALEIIEYISNYPRLLTPCIEFSGTAVQLSESECDEVEMLPTCYKSSPSKNELKFDLLPRQRSSSDFKKSNIVAQNEFPKFEGNDSGSPCNVSVSQTTPDGYSIMTPLLTHQANDDVNGKKS
ncbi:receptor-type guanylate cyclase gcy-5-like isoform X2 [Drosophila hydei]|uniref:Receptor-type guanylate cyclase gcy-5-like isoform X2 n=1 Tax=Drosophila hydei TaxID=7224 RepID=A0A6J1LKL5_DROHY|nr:receptor-type guanylate cyclase gcy-5-like isoform X2 [Drosophila hydei]